MRQMIVVGVMMTGLMLVAGCQDSRQEFEASFNATMKPAHESARLIFALELYVAKKGEAPAKLDELTAFINEEKISLRIPTGWQMEAQITDGQCVYVLQKAGERNVTGNFSTTDLDYGKTLQAYLQFERVWNGLEATDEKH